MIEPSWYRCSSCMTMMLWTPFQVTSSDEVRAKRSPCHMSVRERAAQADVGVQGGLAATVPHDLVAHLPDAPGHEVFELHAADDGNDVPAVAPAGFIDAGLYHGSLVPVEPSAEPVAQQRRFAGLDLSRPLVFGQRVLEFLPRLAPDPVAFVEPAALAGGWVAGQFAAQCQQPFPSCYDRYTYAVPGRPCRCSLPSTSVFTLSRTHLARKVPDTGENLAQSGPILTAPNW